MRQPIHGTVTASICDGDPGSKADDHPGHVCAWPVQVRKRLFSRPSRYAAAGQAILPRRRMTDSTCTASRQPPRAVRTPETSSAAAHSRLCHRRPRRARSRRFPSRSARSRSGLSGRASLATGGLSSIASEIGDSGEASRRWIEEAEGSDGARGGATTRRLRAHDRVPEVRVWSGVPAPIHPSSGAAEGSLRATAMRRSRKPRRATMVIGEGRRGRRELTYTHWRSWSGRSPTPAPPTPADPWRAAPESSGPCPRGSRSRCPGSPR